MVFMEGNDVNKLLIYEDYLQKQGHDTINRFNARDNKFKIVQNFGRKTLHNILSFTILTS